MNMSKGQKGNKENKKPKADKNRVKGVSAYKAAQSQGKPASSLFGKRPDALMVEPTSGFDVCHRYGKDLKGGAVPGQP